MARLCLLPYVIVPLLVLASGCDDGSDATTAPSPTADAAAQVVDAGVAAAATGRLAPRIDGTTGRGIPTPAPIAERATAPGTVSARDAAGRHAQFMAERDARRAARARRAQAALDALARQAAEDRALVSDSETLVWGELQGVGTATFRVARRGAELVDLGSAADAHVITDAGVWQWQTHAAHPRLPGCEIGGGEFSSPARPRGDTVRGEMVRRDSHLRSRERQVVVTPAPVDGASDLTQRATVAASLGPYVFVIESIYLDECGAHGNSETGLVVWDLRSRAPVRLGNAPGLAAIEDALAPTAMVSIRAELRAEEMLEDDLFDDRAHLSAILPFFDARGRLGAEVHFTADACYACGDEEWSSYTRSAHVRTQQLPALLRDVPLDTAAVAFVAEQQPKLRILGASTVSRPSPAVSATLDTMFETEGC